MPTAPARTGFERTKRTEHKEHTMVHWLIVVFLALVLINGLTPWLRKLGLGRLPGDFHFRLFGRDWFIPLASTVLLSLVISLLVKWL